MFCSPFGTPSFFAVVWISTTGASTWSNGSSWWHDKASAPSKSDRWVKKKNLDETCYYSGTTPCCSCKFCRFCTPKVILLLLIIYIQNMIISRGRTQKLSCANTDEFHTPTAQRAPQPRIASTSRKSRMAFQRVWYSNSLPTTLIKSKTMLGGPSLFHYGVSIGAADAKRADTWHVFQGQCVYTYVTCVYIYTIISLYPW